MRNNEVLLNLGNGGGGVRHFCWYYRFFFNSYQKYQQKYQQM